MRRRWVVSVAVVSMALTSVVSTGPVTAGATGSTRTIPHWDASAARERASSRDVLRADSLQRLGASLPEVTWSPVTVSDPTNDPGPNYNDGQSDLTGMRLASTTEPGVPSLFMSVNVVSFAPPWNQSWTDNASYIDWVIDRNNDNRADFVAEFSVFNGLLFGDVYNLNVLTLAGKPSHACNAIPVFNGTYRLPGSFGVYLPWSCIGNPASVKVFARMDIPAFGAVSQDDVPDTTWVSVSSRIRPNAPAAPSTVSAPASLDVTWPAPTSSVWPVTDYVVQYSATSPVSWKTFADGVSTARSARVTGLTAGTSYIVRVATKNKLGMSAFSAPSAARRALAAGVVPTAAGRPGGVPGAGKVTVAWALPAKAGSHPITDYQIEYSLNGGTTWVRLADAVTTVRSAVVSGLTPLSRIVVRVRAKSFAGVGPWSATSLVLAPFTVPSAPRSFAATPGNGSLGLSWIAPSAIGGGTIDRYRVYYRPAPPVAPAAPRSTTEIVNGSETTITSAPWQVRLRVNLGGGGFGLCGGSLVDPQWVLTAAHCVQGQASTSMLVHGGITRQSEMNSLNGVTVDKVMIHASYNALTEENDIALLHLTKPTKGTPIKLFTDTTGPALATPATISGWGRLSSGGSVLPDALQTAAVKVQAAPGDACGSYGADFVPALMLCAGDSNLSGVIDTCQGDSGGPLVITVLGVPRLAGVTSFGQGCATVGFPGVYTRVSTYVRWIQDRVESTWPYVDVMCSNPCLSKVLTGLTNDAPTEVKVRAHTQYGFGAFSPVLTATPTAQPPGAPTALTASGDNTSVTLTWAAPLTDGGSPLTKYQYSEDGTTWVDVALPATTVTFAPVSSAPSTVTFRVRAVNAKGGGAIATFDLPI